MDVITNFQDSHKKIIKELGAFLFVTRLPGIMDQGLPFESGAKGR